MLILLTPVLRIQLVLLLLPLAPVAIGGLALASVAVRSLTLAAVTVLLTLIVLLRQDVHIGAQRQA